MAKYRKIDPKVWNDAKFRKLSDDSKLAFLFILTHPAMTSLGAMRASVPGLAAELGWDVARMLRAIGLATKIGVIRVNREACFVSAPKFLKYNPPEGPNSVKGWLSAIDEIPECPERDEVLRLCIEHLEGRTQQFKEAVPSFESVMDALRDAISDGMPDGIPDAKSDPSPIQEQEQEQDLEQEEREQATTPLEQGQPLERPTAAEDAVHPLVDEPAADATHPPSLVDPLPARGADAVSLALRKERLQWGDMPHPPYASPDDIEILARREYRWRSHRLTPEARKLAQDLIASGGPFTAAEVETARLAAEARPPAHASMLVFKLSDGRKPRNTGPPSRGSMQQISGSVATKRVERTKEQKAIDEALVIAGFGEMPGPDERRLNALDLDASVICETIRRMGSPNISTHEELLAELGKIARERKTA